MGSPNHKRTRTQNCKGGKTESKTFFWEKLLARNKHIGLILRGASVSIIDDNRDCDTILICCNSCDHKPAICSKVA
ncbi:hypothetical protein GJ496_008622 [Pomphorhynchus laevis]|nr:hypothetical protein GJ496_008622 [Pomphorhynchus laevis]